MPQQPNLNEPQTFRTTLNEDKETLAAALRHWLAGCTWNQAKHLITNRRIQVNGNLCVDIARRLKLDDIVHLLPSSAAKPVDAKAVKIVYLDRYLVVFAKPAGVTSVRHFEERKMHVRRRQLQPTLQELAPEIIARQLYEFRHNKETDALRRRNPRSTSEIDELVRRSARNHSVLAVHRLDRDTSGLIMYAREQQAAMAVAKMFRKHTVDRRYIAVVHGECKAQTLVSYMVRDRGDGRRGSIPIVGGKVPAEAKRAVTHVRPIKSIANGKYTVVECKLETGRTHQIRIHLSEAGHMICGERIYNRTTTGELIEDTSGAPRQALHAGKLVFQHPVTSAKVSLKMELPPELKYWLYKLA